MAVRSSLSGGGVVRGDWVRLLWFCVGRVFLFSPVLSFYSTTRLVPRCTGPSMIKNPRGLERGSLQSCTGSKWFEVSVGTPLGMIRHDERRLHLIFVFCLQHHDTRMIPNGKIRSQRHTSHNSPSGALIIVRQANQSIIQRSRSFGLLIARSHSYHMKLICSIHLLPVQYPCRQRAVSRNPSYRSWAAPFLASMVRIVLHLRSACPGIIDTYQSQPHSMPSKSWTEQAVDEFFAERRSPSRHQCDELSLSISGARSLRMVDIPGSLSYTVICAEEDGDGDEAKVISFRERDSGLDDSLVRLARLVHGDLVPDVSFHGIMEGSVPPLGIYVMPLLPGAACIEALRYAVELDSDEEARHLCFITHLAR